MNIMEDLDEQEQKRLFKEALTEWLNAKFAEFGWYSVKTIGLVTFGVILYLYLISHGWHK